MPSDFYAERVALVDKERERLLSEDSSDYAYYQCDSCSAGKICPYFQYNQSGCIWRKKIMEEKLSEIKFSVSDPITFNRLKLLSKYVVELLFYRLSGMDIKKNEVNLLKIVMSELDKIYVDKKGELVDVKSSSVPWEMSDAVRENRERLKKAISTEQEFEELKQKMEKMLKEKKDGKPAAVGVDTV